MTWLCIEQAVFSLLYNLPLYFEGKHSVKIVPYHFELVAEPSPEPKLSEA